MNRQYWRNAGPQFKLCLMLRTCRVRIVSRMCVWFSRDVREHGFRTGVARPIPLAWVCMEQPLPVPTGTVDESLLPQELRLLRQWASDAVPLAKATSFHAVVQDWLSAESTGQ